MKTQTPKTQFNQRRAWFHPDRNNHRLLVMMVGALACSSLFVFSLQNNVGGGERALAMAVAQQQLEQIRSVTYEDSTLNVGTTTSTVTSGERNYTVQRVVASETNSDATAKQLKRITITVTPQAGAGPNWTRTASCSSHSVRLSANGSYLVSPVTPISPTRQKTMKNRRSNNEAGFSLLELILAMAITITIIGLRAAFSRPASASRSREDRKSDAIADVQRALNIMTREISNSGLKLPSGLGAVSNEWRRHDDSDNQSIRIVSNLNGMPDSANGYFEDSDVDDTDEDLKFLMYVDATWPALHRALRKNGTNQTTVLANRIDSLVFRYYDEKVTYDTTVVERCLRHHECEECCRQCEE
jgi:Tfp pilus assembly protein PilV